MSGSPSDFYSIGAIQIRPGGEADPEQAGELETHQIGIPGASAKDKENRRIPFNPKGRLAAILTIRAERA